ncbi:MAG: diguanylate cyclase (GGDEF)-like protein [Glaciecola sp.]|jgi:diguanylate cyclase (GGDEF)-like protein
MSDMVFKTIRSTLTALNSLAIATLCAGFLGFTIYAHEGLYQEAVESDLNALSNNMAEDLFKILGASKLDTDAIISTLLRLKEYENAELAYVYDKDYTQLELYTGASMPVVAEDEANGISFNAELKQAKSIPLGISYEYGKLRSKKSIGEPDSPIGYLLIINDLDEPLSKSRVALIVNALIFSLVITGIGIALSLWLNSRMLLPFQKLARLAHRIKETNDYSIEIDVDGKQEVRDLSYEISSMMDTIHEEEITNREYTEQLMQQRKAMERLANFDGLTGLPNRQFFMETLRKSLSAAERENNDMVLMYFDLDGFKGVNDTHGHEVGDKLLIEASKRTQRFLRHGDLIARLGGDEFLILLYNDPNDFVVTDIAERIIKEISKPFYINDWEIQISVSIGVARAVDAKYNLSDFVSNADVAMYKSKDEGKNTHTIFIPEMMEDNKRRLIIANSIIAGLRENEFEVYYQPKVNADEAIVGFEALLRWHSPTLGFVSPAEFIIIAEQSGKIHQITEWLLQQVLYDYTKILEHFGESTIISLNLSAHDLKNPNILPLITALYESCQIDPKCIEYEVTESTYLENFDMANQFFENIRNMGSSIALDDFGTGYSSLSYLTQIKLDTLKIDKQFVDNLGISERSTLVTKTVIEMAKQLNLNICAEGVETPQQMDFLVDQGCHQLQGYLFGKPIDLASLLEKPYKKDTKKQLAVSIER